MKLSTFERRRERLLVVAAGLFAELEYGRVHMDAVAEAADVAKPTLYKYFATKEALFLAALDQALTDLVAAVARLRNGSDPAEARLRGAIDLVFERIGSLAPALRAMEEADPEERSRKSLRRGFRALRDEIAGLLDEGSERGEFAFADSGVAALAIVGALRMAAVVEPAAVGSAGLVADLLLDGLRRPVLAPVADRPRAKPLEAVS